MMVTFVSQCEKNALKKTRRVLDAFVDRVGDNTWQGILTQEGLNAVRKLLRKTASRSTAVSCHWIRSRARSELIWVVGNRDKFDDRGRVPVNRTQVNRVRADHRADWHYLPLIQALAALAALLHDWGKASNRFQEKLQKDYEGRQGDALRHEWVSCMLLKELVRSTSSESDDGWLGLLEQGNINESDLSLDETLMSSPLHHLPPIASMVAWLVVSHHRLPFQKEGVLPDKAPDLDSMLKWITEEWGYRNDIEKLKVKDCLEFEKGLLSESSRWLKPVRRWARKLLELQSQAEQVLKDGSYRVILHHARLALMLGDHCYSANNEDKIWNRHGLFANTDDYKNPKQSLDQHLVGVCKQAVKNVSDLPVFEREAEVSKATGALKKANKGAYQWQDTAATKIRRWLESGIDQRQAFFAVNMASTGCGKTFANAKVMRALSDDGDSLRFILALGLRTLTLQTGDEYRERIFQKGDSSDLAVLIGSKAIKELHEQSVSEDKSLWLKSGSESEEPLLSSEDWVNYDGSMPKEGLVTVLKSEKDQAFLHAPVLACTIDHLMSATETVRGGRYILPSLRLMSSDLVIDEIDDFTGSDSIAIGRLIHLAGMLGRKVMISSATIPPAMAEGYFNAYRAGWMLFCQTRNASKTIGCAWIDEHGTRVAGNSEVKAGAANVSFAREHQAFVEKRVQQLSTKPVRRKARIIDCQSALKKSHDHANDEYPAKEQWFRAIADSAIQLHLQHCLEDKKTGLNLSFGLIRTANIQPCVQLSRFLLEHDWPGGIEVRLMAYHSQQVLLLRHAQEKYLDSVLKRKSNDKETDPVLNNRVVRKHLEELAVSRKDVKHVLFILVATPVEEVGRDHDFDWAIVEPSSYRSVVQLAGRVLRHRDKEIASANIGILQYNWRTLNPKIKEGSLCFVNPGYERSGKVSFNGKEIPARFRDHDMQLLVDEKALGERLDATPRIQESPKYGNARLALLEHAVIGHDLKNYKSEGPESLEGYLTQSYFLTGLAQYFNPFRRGQSELRLYLARSEEYDTFFIEKDEKGKPVRDVNCDLINQEKMQQIERYELSTESLKRLWFYRDYLALLEEQAELQDLSLMGSSLRYGEISFRESSGGYEYNDQLGLVRK